MGVLSHGGRSVFGHVALFAEGVDEGCVRDVLERGGIDFSDVKFCDDDRGVRIDVTDGVMCEDVHGALSEAGITVIEGIDFSSDGNTDRDVGLEDLSSTPDKYLKYVENTLARVNRTNRSDVRGTVLRRMYGLAGDFQRAGLCEGDADGDVVSFVESVCGIEWPSVSGGMTWGKSPCVHLRESYVSLSKLPRKLYEKGYQSHRKLIVESKVIYEALDRVLNKQSFMYPVGHHVSREEDACVGFLESRWGGGDNWYSLSRNKLVLEGASRKDVGRIEESLGLMSEKEKGGVVSIYGVLSYQDGHVRDLMKEMGYRERIES